MSYQAINADIFTKMLLGGAAVLKEHVEELNALNGVQRVRVSGRNGA